MKGIQIPIGTASWRQRVVLDEKTYYLSVALNERTDRWTFSLYDSENAPIIEGRKILGNRNLLRGIGSFSPAPPPGALVAFDTAGQQRPVNFANLGVNVLLIYVEFSELPVL